MSFPAPQTFGLTENPIINSPYVDNNDEFTLAPPHMQFFLELAGPSLQLLNNGFFLLLGA